MDRPGRLSWEVMRVNVAMGGRVRQRALLVFMVLAGLFAMHGLTAGHDPIMPGGHQPARAMTVLTGAPLQPMGAAAADVAVAGVATAVAMDVSTDVSMSTDTRAKHAAVAGSAGSSAASVASHVHGLPMAATSMGAACIAILTAALALLLLALALAHARSRAGAAPRYRYHDRAARWPTDLGPPRRTSLSLAELSLSRT